MADSGEPVVTTNAQADPRFSAQESVVGYNLRSIVCVPLKFKDVVTGVIYVDNRIHTGLFSERERDLLAAFANQAAIAIENARQFQQVNELKNLLDNVFASITSGVITTDGDRPGDALQPFGRDHPGQLGRQPSSASRSLSACPALDEPSTAMLRKVQTDQHAVVGHELRANLPGRGTADWTLNVAPLKDSSQHRPGPGHRARRRDRKEAPAGQV